MSIAIIGPGGFIGTHLCRWLDEKGAAYTRHSSREGTGIEPVSGLLPESFKYPAGTTAVVYMAQSPYHNAQIDDYPHAINVNALSAERAADLAGLYRVPVFVYVSAANVYAPTFEPCGEYDTCEPDGLYAASKLCGEMLTAYACNTGSTKTRYCALRLFGVYGPGQQKRLMSLLWDRVESGEPITMQYGEGGRHDGGLKMSWVYVDDVCAAIEHAAAGHVAGPVNVAGPRAYSLHETAEAIGAAIGKHPVYEHAGTRRKRDFIADTATMRRVFPFEFRDLNAGIPLCAANVRKKYNDAIGF